MLAIASRGAMTRREVTALPPTGTATRANRTLSDARNLRPITDRWVRDGLSAVLIRRPAIRMVQGCLHRDGRRINFAISDNEDAHGPDGPGTAPIWAVNVHGYFAGGWMYARESARLAERLGWRVVNPSLPGFGGSDPLSEPRVSLAMVTEQLGHVLRHVDAGPVVLLGHSMGGAVAIQHAVAHLDDVLGILYRAGVATPAWRRRHGLLARAMGTILPGLADEADLLEAAVLDTPDLLAGRLYSTMRSVLPDVRHNLVHFGHSLPVGSMLMAVDLRPEVRGLADAGIPMLGEWGCFDRVVTPAAADEFAQSSRTKVQWVPGGHSWMLARPQGQADLLSYVASGRRFRTQVEDRWRQLGDTAATLGTPA